MKLSPRELTELFKNLSLTEDYKSEIRHLTTSIKTLKEENANLRITTDRQFKTNTDLMTRVQENANRNDNQS